MYPRIVQISNEKLKKLLEQKGELIVVGRATSEEIELIDKEMDETDKLIQAEEAKVDISDIDVKQRATGERVDEAIKEMNALKQEIYERMMAQTTPELRTKYDELKKKKDELETQRNKVALKAQKYNDKIIPIAREMMKPFLQDQFEDYDSLQLEGEEIVATIFSHLNDFKTNFKKK